MGQPRFVNGMGDVVMAEPRFLKQGGYEGLGAPPTAFQQSLMAISEATPEGKEEKAALFETEAALYRAAGNHLPAIDMEARAKALRAEAEVMRARTSSRLEQAGSEVLDTTLDTLKKLIPLLGWDWYEREKKKVQDRIDAATGTIRDTSTAPTGPTGRAPTSWYEEPAVIAAGVAVLGVGAWYAFSR